ncbi:MAG: hypothetical protein VR64_00340 [Desulfatitalea sp. BRH_c12]|nr:MAG: hypothetical protein VR64_00340 [Desulfatitalea sp. BRH_c12]
MPAYPVLYAKIGAFDKIALKILFVSQIAQLILNCKANPPVVSSQCSVDRAMRKWIHLIESCTVIIIRSASSQLRF